ncbi:hypothetical protein TNCV_387101 [Trichonephila clavipes]|nr:hypothetical protein TNCV_387101 [Trichonephila clavipes]
MVSQRLTQITPPAAETDQLWQRVEAACLAVPQEHIQSLFESMCNAQQLFRMRPKVTGKPKVRDIWGISVV